MTDATCRTRRHGGWKNSLGLEASAGYTVGESDRLILKEASHSLETGAAGPFSGQMLMPGAAPRRMKILCLHSACGTYLKLGTGFTGQTPMPAAAPRRMKTFVVTTSVVRRAPRRLKSLLRTCTFSGQTPMPPAAPVRSLPVGRRMKNTAARAGSVNRRRVTDPPRAGKVRFFPDSLRIFRSAWPGRASAPGSPLACGHWRAACP